MNLRISLGWLLCASLCSCSEENPYAPNPVPFLSLDSVSSTNIVQFKDSLRMYLRFEDGDGDLGALNPDSNSLSVQDARFNRPDFYFVPAQAPANAKVHIKGRFVLRMKNLFLLGSGNTEPTTFTLRIKDRSGNWSNTVSTPLINIRR
ncbi:MAG: hypothetical protein RL160_1138 [Bacteroidota bacterium]|jgi:hypothetical protein